jgi:adenosylcobinamide-phosphate synthase
MLLVALRLKDITKQTRRVTAALSKRQKMLARHALSQIVLRETQKTSSLGMVKANIESTLLRYSYQYCAVIFWYFISGGMGALTYRLIYELSLCWNNKLLKFRHFGQPVRHVVNILQSLPSKLACLSIALVVNINQGTKALFQRISYQCNHLFILNLCGASFGIELGGPVYYEQRKVLPSKGDGNRPVILSDNIRAIAATNRAIWVWLTLYFMGCTLSFLVTK